MDCRFFVVVYDIVNDKIRLKVARHLDALGERVQYSVFELYLDKKEINTLSENILNLIEQDVDSIRFYQLCSSCRKSIKTFGVGKVTHPPGVVIV